MEVYVVVYGKTEWPMGERVKYNEVEIYLNLDDIVKKFELGDFNDDDPIRVDGSESLVTRLNECWYHIKIYKRSIPEIR